jgi:cytochrome c-type biogenesis protein
MSPTVFVAVFGAGVASSLSPCVAPLVPVYAASIFAHGEQQRSSSRAARDAIGFVVGLAVVFASLGVLAGIGGSAIDDAQRLVTRIGGGLIVLFGVLLIAPPKWFIRFRAAPLGSRAGFRKAAGPAGSIVLGMTVAATWTPCAGPLLGAALVAATTSAGALRGAALLSVYAVGVGTPFVALSALLPTLRKRRSRQRTPRPLLSGLTLVVLGLLIATGAYGLVTSPIASVWGGGT